MTHRVVMAGHSASDEGRERAVVTDMTASGLPYRADFLQRGGEACGLATYPHPFEPRARAGEKADVARRNTKRHRNKPDERRIGLAVRYIPTHLKQAVGSRDWATLVRGKDSYHHFEPAHVPRRDLEPEALEFHKMVSEEQVRVLYRGTGKTAYRA